MHRRFPLLRTVLTALTLAAFGAPGRLGHAETTPPKPGSAQPTVPGLTRAVPPKPDSPVVEEMVTKRPPLVAKKQATQRSGRHPHRVVHRRGLPRELDRPALAGVELVAPLPPPPEPPHVVVPVPAYPLDSLAAAFFTPPPPIICHPTRRDPTQPDLRLYKESPVECEPDNP